MTGKHPINADTFDAMFPGKGPERLWGLNHIAECLGVSVDKARRLARRPHTPIYQPDGGMYFANRSELEAWLRRKR